MSDDAVRTLDNILLEARRDHYGEENADSLQSELKGTALLSKSSLNRHDKNGDCKNILVAEQVIKECAKCSADDSIQVFGAIIYGEKGIFTQIDNGRLSKPFATILENISIASRERDKSQRVDLVFDNQMCGNEAKVATSVRHFVHAEKLPNVSHYPLVGVSHVSPGIQLADICAFIMYREASGDDPRYIPWRQQLQSLEWQGELEGQPRCSVQKWVHNGTELIAQA